jgi:hypothetical protein
MAKEEENCVKTIDVKRDELEMIGPITKAEAKRKIQEIQNAKLGNGNGSSSSSKKRKAAEGREAFNSKKNCEISY